MTSLSPLLTEAAGARSTLDAGELCTKTSGACAPIKPGAAIPPNEELLAGDAGATLKLADGTTLDLAPGTALKLQVTMAIPLGPGEPVKAQTMTLISGKLRVDASARGKTRRAILLRGPRKAQIIASGEAAISLQKDTLSAVNNAGKMLATTANDWNEIPAGKAFSLSKEEPKPQLRDPLPAPRITGGRWVSTSLADASEALSLTWGEVPGAASYELRLQSASGAILRRSSLGPRETSFSLSGLAPGAYELRLSVHDAGGLDGGQVPPVKLAVLGVTLPPGGFRSGPSTVQVAEGQSIGLAHGNGVELAYDKSTSYTPVGAEFVMRGDTVRLLRFRIPGASQDATLRVEPRSLAAVVELSPKDARWPRDTVTAVIRLINKTGGSIPSDIRMNPTVTLGVTPIKATFQEDGPGVLRGTIAPQPGPLPAALRIEVQDQHGIYLGRGFLEIARLSGEMSGQEWHVEMLWCCATCSERNLGRHTQCQRCGKPKTGKEEYVMPGDTSAAAAVSDPELLRMATAGANWRCRFCGSDQRRYDGACGHCGAAQEQGVDLGALPSPTQPGPHAAGPAVARPLPATARSQRWHLLLILPALVLLLVLCGVFTFRQRAPESHHSSSPTAVAAIAPAPTFRDVEARLTGVEWEHAILVERYKVLPGEGFEEARPADAFAVKKSGQRSHHTERVPDGFSTETYTETVPDGTRTETYTDRESCGQTCTSRPQTCSNQCTPGKNGFAKCKQVCSGGGQSCTTKYCTVTKTRQIPKTRTVTKTRQVPRFKDVPVMRDWYVWNSWGWGSQRTLKANGTSPETRWPADAEVALNKGLGKGEKERTRQLRTYTLLLAEPGGEHRILIDDEETFSRYAKASAFRLRIEQGRARILEASPPTTPSTSAPAPTPSR